MNYGTFVPKNFRSRESSKNFRSLELSLMRMKVTDWPVHFFAYIILHVQLQLNEWNVVLSFFDLLQSMAFYKFIFNVIVVLCHLRGREELR